MKNRIDAASLKSKTAANGYSVVLRKSKGQASPDLAAEIPENKTCSFNEKSFLINGKSYFVLSGEIHYFRVDSNLWRKHLQQMKDAGLNTVSSYIPWSLHEQVEGCPDFSGKYGSNLNLEGFILLCKELGLNLILKPGPFILAELSMHGIPPWFFKKYPQAIACSDSGEPYPAKYTCLNHPVYREKVLQWYNAILPFLAPYQISNGGPLILMQVCNEVGLFQWLSGKGDYSPSSVQAYQEYLCSKYGSIQAVNAKYNTQYLGWNKIHPPTGAVRSQYEYFSYQDWHNFHRFFYADYIIWLVQNIRLRKINIPLFHNVPGWVFSRAKEMPVCLSMYNELARQYPDIILGVDHIPENLSYRNFHDDRLVNEFTKALHGGVGPLYVAELQAGTREANIRVYPKEMELFYKSCLANGVVSMNFYMYSQGQNPPGWGVYDSYFYLQTPLDVNGEPGDFYQVTQNIGKLIKVHGARLCECKANARQALIFYPPNYNREFTRPLFTRENLEDPSQVGAKLDPKFVTDELLFDGIGKMLAMDNQEYDVVALPIASINKLSNYKQLWLATTELMDAASQKLLLEYVKQGGHLICLPTIPKKDLDARPCTILADGLHVHSDQILDDFEGMIRWAQSGEEIHAMNYIETFQENSSLVLAKTRKGHACGIIVSAGKGSATIFGTGFGCQAAAHQHAWQRLGLSDDFRGAAVCDNPLATTRVRCHDDGGGYLFILNYHNQPIRTKACILGRALPLEGDFYLPAISGLVLPFDMPLSDDCTLHRTTSEISEINISPDDIVVAVSGHPKTPGRLTLRTQRRIQCVQSDKGKVLFAQESGRLSIDFEHTGNPQLMTIRFHDSQVNCAG